MTQHTVFAEDSRVQMWSYEDEKLYSKVIVISRAMQEGWQLVEMDLHQFILSCSPSAAPPKLLLQTRARNKSAQRKSHPVVMQVLTVSGIAGPAHLHSLRALLRTKGNHFRQSCLTNGSPAPPLELVLFVSCDFAQ